MIYLVRHCNFDNPRGIQPGRLPVSLSDLGKRQAERLNAYFTNINISHIFSSPVQRCKETVEIFNSMNAPVSFDVRLAEVHSAYQGELIEDQWRVQLYGKVEILGGESPQDVQNRMAEFWRELRFSSNDNTVICSHGDPLFFLYQYLKGEKALNDLSVLEPESYQVQGSVRLAELDDEKEIRFTDTLFMELP